MTHLTFNVTKDQVEQILQFSNAQTTMSTETLIDTVDLTCASQGYLFIRRNDKSMFCYKFTNTSCLEPYHKDDDPLTYLKIVNNGTRSTLIPQSHDQFKKAYDHFNNLKKRVRHRAVKRPLVDIAKINVRTISFGSFPEFQVDIARIDENMEYITASMCIDDFSRVKENPVYKLLASTIFGTCELSTVPSRYFVMMYNNQYNTGLKKMLHILYTDAEIESNAELMDKYSN
jgi:hypothetical protein